MCSPARSSRLTRRRYAACATIQSVVSGRRRAFLRIRPDARRGLRTLRAAGSFPASRCRSTVPMRAICHGASRSRRVETRSGAIRSGADWRIPDIIKRVDVSGHQRRSPTDPPDRGRVSLNPTLVANKRYDRDCEPTDSDRPEQAGRASGRQLLRGLDRAIASAFHQANSSPKWTACCSAR